MVYTEAMNQTVMSKPSKGDSVAAKFAQVQEKVAMKVPVKIACKDAELSRSTYYLILNRGKDVPSQDLKEEAADARTSSGKSPTTERCDGDSQESTSARSA